MNDTYEILLEFASCVKKILQDNLKKVVVYGSYARGDYNENSDIDVMIMTTLTETEIKTIENDIFDIAFDFQMEYGVDISVIVKNEANFDYWLGTLPFYNNIQKEGVVIINNKKADLCKN